MNEPGQIAYEARFAGQPGALRAWGEQPSEVREVWARVERAVLAAAHRLQIVEDAWDEHLSRPSITMVGPSVPTGLGMDGAIVLSGELTPMDRPAQAAASAAQARTAGFSGNACTNCGAFAMVRTGTCETCQVCSETSGGCS